MENQANKAEKFLKGQTDSDNRSWFQTKKERKDEKGLLISFIFSRSIFIKNIK